MRRRRGRGRDVGTCRGEWREGEREGKEGERQV